MHPQRRLPAFKWGGSATTYGTSALRREMQSSSSVTPATDSQKPGVPNKVSGWDGCLTAVHGTE